MSNLRFLVYFLALGAAVAAYPLTPLPDFAVTDFADSSQLPASVSPLPSFVPTQAIKETEPHQSQKEGTKENRKPWEGGVFGKFRIGPEFGLSIFETPAASAPGNIDYVSGPTISLELKFNDYAGMSLGAGRYWNDADPLGALFSGNPIGTTKDTYKTTYTQFEGRGVVYPFGGALFLSSALGYRKLHMIAPTTVYPESAPETGVPFELDWLFESLYITPQLGFLWVWDGPAGGFSLGTQIGAQLNVWAQASCTSSLDTDNADIIAEVKSSDAYIQTCTYLNSDVYHVFTTRPLWQWNVLQIGWLF